MKQLRGLILAICRAGVLCLVLIGIGLVSLNMALIVVGVLSFQILNPAYVWLIAGCLGGWLLAFAVAGAVHLAAGRAAWSPAAGYCIGCGYNLRGLEGNTCCPECGRNKFGEGDARVE